MGIRKCSDCGEVKDCHVQQGHPELAYCKACCVIEAKRMLKVLKAKPARALKVFGYGGTIARYLVATTSIKKALDLITATKGNQSSRNWIAKRMCETGNATELRLANEKPGVVIIVK